MHFVTSATVVATAARTKDITLFASLELMVMLLTAAALDLTRCGSRPGRSPASGGDRGTGRRRAGRGRTDRAERARMRGLASAGQGWQRC